MSEYYPVEDPRRAVDEGLDMLGAQLGTACISFSLENDFCRLANLIESSKQNPRFPVLRLYSSLNRLYWHNFEELQEMGAKGIVESIETKLLFHGNIGIEDAYRVNRVHSHLY